MGIRKTTQRDERRRRVLVDERILTPSREDTAKSTKSRSGGRARRYAEAALIDRQPRICSFVPIRPWTVSVWFLAGLSFVVAHATAFALMVRYSPSGMPSDLSPIQLTGPGTLSNWSASLMLLLAAVLSALIVQFRQHRIDDYRGEYRVWYWVVAGMVLASIDASIGGHQVLLQSATHAAARYEIRHASLWINGVLSICVSGVCVRMLLEVRPSRGTVATSILAAAAYLGHMLLSTGIWPLASSDLQTLSLGLARLTGHYLLVMSLVLYSRYVILDAQGMITRATTKKKKAARPKRSAKTAKSSQQSSSPSAAKPTLKSTTQRDSTTEEAPRAPSTAQTRRSQPTPARPNKTDPPEKPQHDDPYDSDDEPATLKMSKSERRKARKQKRRDRKAA